MSTVSDSLKVTRTFLNDDAGLQWHDQVLMPKHVMAHNEMMSKFELNSIQLTRESTALITIDAGVLNMVGLLPTDFIEPIKMDERIPGDPDSNAIPMTKYTFAPNLDKTEDLRYWMYKQNMIQFVGATTPRQVRLYYIAGISPPVLTTDPLPIALAETFLGPRTAAFVMIGNQIAYDTLTSIAEDNLSKLIRRMVKADQNLPVRKKPFSYAIKARRRWGL